MTRWMAVAAVSMMAVSPLHAQVQRGTGLPQPPPLFSPDNWWNVDISSAPVDTNSANFINFIGATTGLHPDFGGDADYPEVYGMIYITVSGTQPLVPITWVEFGDQSDDEAAGRPGGYPIP